MALVFAASTGLGLAEETLKPKPKVHHSQKQKRKTDAQKTKPAMMTQGTSSLSLSNAQKDKPKTGDKPGPKELLNVPGNSQSHQMGAGQGSLAQGQGKQVLKKKTTTKKGISNPGQAMGMNMTSDAVQSKDTKDKPLTGGDEGPKELLHPVQATTGQAGLGNLASRPNEQDLKKKTDVKQGSNAPGPAMGMNMTSDTLQSKDTKDKPKTGDTQVPKELLHPLYGTTHSTGTGKDDLASKPKGKNPKKKTVVKHGNNAPGQTMGMNTAGGPGQADAKQEKPKNTGNEDPKELLQPSDASTHSMGTGKDDLASRPNEPDQNKKIDDPNDSTTRGQDPALVGQHVKSEDPNEVQ